MASRIFALASIGLLLGAPASAQHTPDLGSAAARILDARCGACHVPDSDDAKARHQMDSIRDLPRLVADFVTPGDPDDSELWWPIADGDMPPKDAETGALSAEENALLREWIVAGAPLPVEPPPVVEEPGFLDRSAAWIGRIHPLAIHFPIALLLAAALAELCARGRAPLYDASRYGALLGSFGAVAAALLGWIDANYGAGPADVDRHRWMGVSLAVLAVGLIVIALSLGDAAEGKARRRYRIVLAIACLLVGLTAHEGGLLVYGENYFHW